jgi:hypothetical protein
MVARVWRAPVLEHPFETPFAKIGLRQILRHIANAKSASAAFSIGLVLLKMSCPCAIDACARRRQNGCFARFSG